MKGLTLALFIAAVANVPAAEALLIPLPGGGLQSGVPYTLRIGDGGSGTAVMLQAVVRGRLELEASVTVPAGATVDLPLTIPSRASRVILVLDVAPDINNPDLFGSVTVQPLDQNLIPIIVAMTFSDPHVELVYEVAP